jgi:hypothetical protein
VEPQSPPRVEDVLRGLLKGRKPEEPYAKATVTATTKRAPKSFEVKAVDRIIHSSKDVKARRADETAIRPDPYERGQTNALFDSICRSLPDEGATAKKLPVGLKEYCRGRMEYGQYQRK